VDEEKGKEKKNKLWEEIMKKFFRKEILYVETSKLNPKILAYMSVRQKIEINVLLPLKMRWAR